MNINIQNTIIYCKQKRHPIQDGAVYVYLLLALQRDALLCRSILSTYTECVHTIG
jgi:hypothetical protein